MNSHLHGSNDTLDSTIYLCCQIQTQKITGQVAKAWFIKPSWPIFLTCLAMMCMHAVYLQWLKRLGTTSLKDVACHFKISLLTFF